MEPTVRAYNEKFLSVEREIFDRLAQIIQNELPNSESKIWHAHPVWFIKGNPIVGYSHQKAGCRLMFWSGADFEEADLSVQGTKFKDASIFYNSVESINEDDLVRWLRKSELIQWDYKNLVKRKGKLERIQ